MEGGQMAGFAGVMAMMAVIIIISIILGLLFSWFISKKINTLVNGNGNPFLEVIVFPIAALVLGFTIISWFWIFDDLSTAGTLEYAKRALFFSAPIFLINSLLFFFKSFKGPNRWSSILLVVIATIVTIYSYYFVFIREIPGTNNYAVKRLEEIRKEKIFKTKPFSCENMYVYGDTCRRLQIVQEAIMYKNPNICNKINTLNNNLPGTWGEFALCIGQFPKMP